MRMRLKRPATAVTILVTIFSLAWISTLAATDAKGSRREAVSLVSLIAEPQQYDGKAVLVTGYALLGFEQNELFLSPYDAQEFNTLNAISLDFGKTDGALRRQWTALFDHETVDIEATFYYPKEAGAKAGSSYWTGYPNGWLVNITSMRLHDFHPRIPTQPPPHTQ